MSASAPLAGQRAENVTGSITPRIYTGNYSGLTLGDELLSFARNTLGEQPDPWHEWLARHALEVRPDGTLRFRTLLLLVARQNGKSWFLRVLVLWMMFTGRARFVLWTSQTLSVSGNMHRELCQTINKLPHLRKRVKAITQRYEEKSIELVDGAMFRIVANGPDAARSLSVDLLIVDELRTFDGWDGWNALEATTAARPNALIVCASNAGDDKSVVLNDFRDGAEAAVGNPFTSTFLAEWSAPDGSSIHDVNALALANPALGHGRTTLGAIVAAREKMKEPGFRTEYMCMRVKALDPAVPGWAQCSDAGMSIVGLPRFAGLDVSLDGCHVTMCIAARMPDGRIGVRVLKAWDSVSAAWRSIDGLKLAERVAWIANGPSAAVATQLRTLPGSLELPTSDVASACMSLAAAVSARTIVHPGDPLLDDQVGGTAKLWTGDRWTFTRRGGHADAAYAAALAIRALEGTPKPVAAWEGSLVI